MSYNQNQINGLKKRIGAGFAKYGREGSVIKWLFHWSDSGQLQTGYNQGIIKNNTTNAELLAILKNKIFTGFLTRKTCKNVPYPQAIKSSIEIYILGDTAENDILLFSLNFYWREEANKKIRDVEILFSDEIKLFFLKGELKYIEEMFADFRLKITNATSTSSALSKLEQLRKELQQKMQAAGQQFEKYDVRRFTADQQQEAIRYCTDITKQDASEYSRCIQYYCELCNINNWVKPSKWE